MICTWRILSEGLKIVENFPLRFVCLFVFCYKTRKSLLRLPFWDRSKPPWRYALWPRSSSCGPTEGTPPPRTTLRTIWGENILSFLSWFLQTQPNAGHRTKFASRKSLSIFRTLLRIRILRIFFSEFFLHILSILLHLKFPSNSQDFTTPQTNFS